jgi:hypothetical protein
VLGGSPNPPLSPIDRSSRQKINKETSELLHTLDQIDMVDIYRADTQKLGNKHSFLQLMELYPK